MTAVSSTSPRWADYATGAAMGAFGGWPDFICIPKTTWEATQRERDEAVRRLAAHDHETATLRARARALEDEVAKLRPAMVALEDARQRYEALVKP